MNTLVVFITSKIKSIAEGFYVDCNTLIIPTMYICARLYAIYAY